MKEVLTNMKAIYFNGKLSLSDKLEDMNRMNYIITSKVDHVESSITDILDTIYASESCDRLVRVSLRPYNRNESINGFGKLAITRGELNIEGYHINSLDFESKLYNLLGQDVELVLEDYTDSVTEVEVHVS